MNSLGQLCRSHGFWGKNGAYYRVSGDGVLACVFQKESAYIDPSSPEYASKKRSGKYIMVGLWSLYAELPEALFDGKIIYGWLSPMCFIGRRGTGFYGPQYELDLMCNHVLPQLDAIQTQDQLADACVKLTKIEHCGHMSPQVDLCAAFLKCNRDAEALERVQAAFTYRWIQPIGNQCEAMKQGEDKIRLPVSAAKREQTQRIFRLWAMIAGEQWDNIEAYLKENYRNNLARVKAARENFASRTMK